MTTNKNKSINKEQNKSASNNKGNSMGMDTLNTTKDRGSNPKATVE